MLRYYVQLARKDMMFFLFFFWVVGLRWLVGFADFYRCPQHLFIRMEHGRLKDRQKKAGLKLQTQS